MIITTERLHYLWAVAETGSFAAAGRRLGVSGAAVQQVIRHFEHDLDAPLFRRSPGRSPVLTDLGRQFYFHALDIIPRLEGLENLAATRGQGQEGQLRIGLHGFVMFPEVRAALVELQQAFPLLEIFLWRVVAAADHPLSRIRGSLSLDDLLRHRQLLPLPGVISSDAFYDSFRLSSHLVHYSQFYQLQEMLLAGMGFAVFPAQLARPFVEQGRLKLLELDFDDGISTTAVELAWVEPLGTAGRWLVERLRELPPEEGGR